MNIFFLDPDPDTCAQLHCDKHNVKMILEYAQLLSTAHHVIERQFAQRIVTRRGCFRGVDGNIADWLGGDRVFGCFVAALSAYRKAEDEPARRER